MALPLARPDCRSPALCALATRCALAALCAVAPLRAQDTPEPDGELVSSRRQLRHDELIERYTKLQAELGDGATKDEITARIVELTLERQVLLKLGPLAELRALAPAALAARLAPHDKTAEEELAFARFCRFAELLEPFEAALARARDQNPELEAETDRLLAECRGEPVPRGGYHRYRGLWLALEDRDRCRALDDALERLWELRVPRIDLPFEPSTERGSLDRFVALGAAGPDRLRSAAAVVRQALRADYDEVRSWLASYSRQPRLRRDLLDKVEQMTPLRVAALTLIDTYDKSQQPEVDARRAELAQLYDEYVKLCERDRQALQRVSADSAWTLLQRIRAREAALAAVDGYLSAHEGQGLPPVRPTPAADADAGTERRLPGREQSELEDVLWLVLHLHAGAVRDALERSEELLRAEQALSAWERWLCHEVLADAVLAYDREAPSSLDDEERRFVERLNRYRRVLGLRPFELEERCNVASRKHSQEMVDLGYFGHVSPVARNRGPSDRVRLEGYTGGVGENCLAGHVDGQGAFEGWYHSPGHHRNMVSRGIHLGVGAAADHSMWTMVAGGADLTWRSLCRDLAPDREQACRAAAEDLATQSRGEPRNDKQAARQTVVLGTAHGLLPDILPAVARIAFAAATDPRHVAHPAAPGLLAFVAEADVDTPWRPLQIAAIAAAIDYLRLGTDTAARQKAFQLVARHVESTARYDPAATPSRRAGSVLALRRHWEDEAQWRFRSAKGPPPSRPLPGGLGDGPSLKSPRKALTRAQRLRLAKRFGGGTRTEQAVDRGLEFLASVQDEDGAWRARSFVTRSSKFSPKDAGIGSADWEVAMTGLSLLAFVSAGHTTAQGDHTATVRKGADFLLQRIVDYGKFENVSSHYMYSHAMATQALCELYSFTADPYTGVGAQLAVDYLMWAQHQESGGWRYAANEFADTSVTGWVVLAQNAAFKAGLDVAGFRDALRYIDSVTRPGYYEVGYQGWPPLGKENLRLTAVGMTCRLFLGETAHSPKVRLPAFRLKERLPSAANPDFYYLYYGTLALHQVGGEPWDTWNAALMKTLLDMQVDDRASPYHGSWKPTGDYGATGGRIFQTALGVLMLTTYYRYDRAPKIRIHPFTGDLDKAAAPFLDVLQDPADEHEREVVLREMVDRLGPSLTPALARMIADQTQKIAFRRQLARSLCSIAGPQHEALLLPLLGETDGEIAEGVAQALVSITSQSSVPALIDALDHKERRVRGFAARALGRLGAGAAVAPLGMRLDKEQDPWCKNELQAALRRIAHRGDMAAVVEDALQKDEGGRLAVLEALDLLEQSGIGKAVAAARQREPKLYRRAVELIAREREAAPLPLLLLLLESEDLDTRTEALRLLRALTGVEHAFDPAAAVNDRRQALDKIDAWWREHGAGYGARAGKR